MASPWEKAAAEAAPATPARRGAPWIEAARDQQALPPAAAPAPERGFWDDLGDNVMAGARGAQDALTLGYSDEILGGIGGLQSLLTDGDFSKGYNAYVEPYRAEVKDDWENQPIGAWTGTGAGILATGAATAGPKAASILYGEAAPSFGRALATNAAAGAGVGSVAGFGTGEGDLRQRLQSAMFGGALGGGLGAGGSVAFPLGRLGWDIAKNLTFPAPAQAQADKLIGAAMARGGGPGPAAAALDAGGWSGSPMAVADTGPNMARLGRMATTAPGEAVTIADQMLAPRMGERSQRIGSAIDDHLAEGSSVGVTGDWLRGSQRAAAGPNYEAAYRAPPVPIDALAGIADRRALAAAYTRARAIADIEGLQLPATMPAELDWRTLDLMKRALDDEVKVAGRSTSGIGPTQANALAGLRDDFRERLISLNPAYEKALAEFAGPAGVLEAMRLGQAVGTKTPEAIRAELARMTPEARDGYAQGYARSLQTLIGRADNTNPNVLDNPTVRARIEAIFPDAARRDTFLAGLRTEGTMRRTEGTILGGSQTMARASEMSDAARTLQEGAGAIGDALTGNHAGLLRRGLNAAARASQGVSPEVAAIIVREILSADPSVQAALFQRLINSASAGAGPRGIDRMLLGTTFGGSNALGHAAAAAIPGQQE